jgi:hypothetical protein
VSQIGFNHRSKFQRQGVESKLEAKLDVKLQATLGSTDNFHAVAMAALGFGNDASAACDTKNNCNRVRHDENESDGGCSKSAWGAHHNGLSFSANIDIEMLISRSRDHCTMSEIVVRRPHN